MIARLLCAVGLHAWPEWPEWIDGRNHLGRCCMRRHCTAYQRSDEPGTLFPPANDPRGLGAPVRWADLLAIALGVAIVAGLASCFACAPAHIPAGFQPLEIEPWATPLPPCHEVTPAPGVSCFTCADEKGDKERIGLGSAECAHLVKLTYPKVEDR